MAWLGIPISAFRISSVQKIVGFPDSIPCLEITPFLEVGGVVVVEGVVVVGGMFVIVGDVVVSGGCVVVVGVVVTGGLSLSSRTNGILFVIAYLCAVESL